MDGPWGSWGPGRKLLRDDDAKAFLDAMPPERRVLYWRREE